MSVEPRGFFGVFLCRLCKACYSGDVFRARASAVLLTAAGHERLHIKAFTDIHCPHAFVSAHFMRRHAVKIDARGVNVDRYLTESLNSVRMEYRARCFLFYRGTKLGNVVDRARFVRAVYDGYESRVFVHGIHERIDIHAT